MDTPPSQQPEKPANSVEQKLDEVLVVLKKIEKNTHEPFWPSVVKFTLANIWSIVGFGFMLFFVWKIWGVLGGISEGVDFLQNSSTGLLEKLSSGASGLKFWE
jgi:hypothetical protein